MKVEALLQPLAVLDALQLARCGRPLQTEPEHAECAVSSNRSEQFGCVGCSDYERVAGESDCLKQATSP